MVGEPAGVGEPAPSAATPGDPAGDGPRGRLEASLARVAPVAAWLRRWVRRLALVAAVAAWLAWVFTVGPLLLRPVGGTVLAVVAAAVVAVPAAVLLDAGRALQEVANLPSRLGGVAARRAAQVTGAVRAGPAASVANARGAGVLAAVREVRSIVEDVRDVHGGYGTVVRLASPAYGALVGAAIVGIPVLTVIAVVAGALRLLL